MEKLLQLIQDGGRQTDEILARDSGLSVEEVREKIQAWEDNGTIKGYKGILDQGMLDEQRVKAFIEVKITPEREGGFDRLATRIAKFDEVSSCSLFSGGYDLMVVVNGKSLMDVASFVSEKLSTLDGVISTQSHFQLKTYKLHDIRFLTDETEERLPVTP